MPNSGTVSGILETSKSGARARLQCFSESWRGILEGNPGEGSERERERKGKGAKGESKGESKGKGKGKGILFYDY